MSNERVALITGSSGGLGKKTALLLGEKKWKLALNGRRQNLELAQLQSKLHLSEVEAHSFIADVSLREDAFRLVEETVQTYGRIDTLVHAVGPFIRERKLFIEHTVEEIEQMVTGNLLSAIWMAHAVLPHMRRQKWGRIIFFGFGRVAEAPSWPDRSVYATAKTGLVSLTKTLAVEEAPFGITVNMICPGDIVGNKKEMSISEVSVLIDEETPRGRPGSGEDVARVIQFLTEDQSDFITGNMIQVTGGLDVIHPVSKRHGSS